MRRLRFPLPPGRRPLRTLVLAPAALALAACAPSGATQVTQAAAAPAPAPAVAPATALPPIPRVEGPLAIRVTYPSPGQALTARDSNFIFGSVGHGDARLWIDGQPIDVRPNGAWLAFIPVPADSVYDMVATLGADTVRHTLPVRLPAPRGTRPATPPPGPPPNAIEPGPVLVGAPASADSGDHRVAARPVPGGTYRWFLVPGTVVRRTGVERGFARLELAPGLDVWVPEADVHPLPTDTVLPRRVVGDLRVRSADEHADVIMPIASPPPYLVEVEGSSLVLTLYGTTANTDRMSFAPDDSFVRNVTWKQLPGDVARYEMELAEPAFGYLTLWRDGAFVLRVRRAPAVDDRAPLRGLRIAVDAGHPPVGATGPTGLYEAEAALAISQALRDELERRGATVIMTRTTMDPVALGDRPVTARRAGAHALVSIHLNAFPDGVNPFVNNGTSTYYFQPFSAALARTVQDGMVRHMGLRDLGTFYGNLALVRTTWMPSALAEGAFLMIPEQEAALRTPEYQRAYALGVADGLEEYFRALRGSTR